MTQAGQPGKSWFLRHWLFIANAGAWTFALLPLLAPALMLLGLESAADSIYAAYSLACHQWAHRSFFLGGNQFTYSMNDLITFSGGTNPFSFIGSSQAGYKVAFCERDLAIYLSVAAMGTVYAIRRWTLLGLQPWAYLFLLIPIALDGFTQLFGWRESTPILRLTTGAGFGIGTVWFIYPRFDTILNRRRARPLISTLRAVA